MGEEWIDKIRKRIEENFPEVVEEMDDEEIKDAIREAIDMKQLIKEVISENIQIREALKEKITEGLTDLISRFEDLEFDGESFDDFLMKNIDMEEKIKELLNSDEDLKKYLDEKIKEAVIDNLGNFDENNLPEWDDFVKLLKIDDIVMKISASEDFQELLGEKVHELMKSLASDNISEDDLPENVLEDIGFKEQIRKTLENNEFRQVLGDYLKDSIRKRLLSMVSLENADLSVFLKDDPGFKNVISKLVSELLRNPKIVSKIRKNLKLELVGKESLKEKIMGIFTAG